MRLSKETAVRALAAIKRFETQDFPASKAAAFVEEGIVAVRPFRDSASETVLRVLRVLEAKYSPGWILKYDKSIADLRRIASA